MCTHCSFWNFVFVKYFLQIFSCLGTRVADWYIPFLTSWTPLSHEYTFSYVHSKSLHTNKTQKEQYTNVGAYLSCPPLPVSCSANTTNTFLFCLCNQHRKILCVCSLPHSLFLCPEGYCDHKLNVRTGGNAFWALCSNVAIGKLGWVLQLTAEPLWNWGDLCSNTTLASLGEK